MENSHRWSRPWSRWAIVLSVCMNVFARYGLPNKERELEIIQADDRINHMEEEINDLAIESLALLAPVASDLRKVIGTIKIATELERIGDYAKNIAKFLIKQDRFERFSSRLCNLYGKRPDHDVGKSNAMHGRSR